MDDNKEWEDVALQDTTADQLRLPSGRMAAVAARSLNHRNRGLIERSVLAMHVGPGQRSLDVGFGGGLSLHLLLGQPEAGQVCGVDPSVDLVERAERIFHTAVSTARLELRVGSATNIPLALGRFERVLTCQTLYFWADVQEGLAELQRVLTPGGRLVIAMMPKPLQESFGFAERGYQVRSHEELNEELEEAGFTDVHAWPRGTRRESWIVVANRAR